MLLTSFILSFRFIFSAQIMLKDHQINPKDLLKEGKNEPLGGVGGKNLATFFRFSSLCLEQAANRGLYRAAAGLAARRCRCNILQAKQPSLPVTSAHISK